MTQDQIPEKFRDSETGALRTEALLASYAELERKLNGMVALPGADANAEAVAAFHRALGVPDSADGYEIRFGDAAMAADPEVNARLHAAGFTPDQAQLVYDLAAEYVLPLLDEAGGALDTDREETRLAQHFGGAERWQQVSRQLKVWGRANLPDEAFEALSGSYDGVLALHRLMTTGEPPLGRAAGKPGPLDQAALDELMRDPKYWRERDPDIVARVTRGFQELYSG
jgi:hypothetical protein